MKVISNGHLYPIIYQWELTDAEKADFDWADDSMEFVRYRGQLYCISEFESVSPTDADTRGWDGYQGDSYFSGVLMRYPREDGRIEDTEHVIMGTYYA